ncbi:NTP transferase domain-containing protein [Haladaptatus sp. QDMS2]|uniref:NTP transferase domain-containing protein n=1 Tax=Haladaptatus sp. QDMS2 TaxID=3033391 RepID=UPI0023E7B767|nr:NTP transferase domain-containing protein [Haladaptatus sp. QDMS2]
MCGGRGTRLNADVEKPLYKICGTRMVDCVVAALDESRVDRVVAVVSPHTPETARHLDDLPQIRAPGEGYVSDLGYALERVSKPVLTVAADLPLLSGVAVDTVLDQFTGESLTVCVPAALKARLGVSADLTFDHEGGPVAPTGVNVVAPTDDERMMLTNDHRLAVNVNRPTDAQIAEAWL